MTEAELRQLYTEAVKIARAERKMRLFVFRDRPATLKIKLAEMDRLLYILALIKDYAKTACEPVPEQATLLDVPRKRDDY